MTEIDVPDWVVDRAIDSFWRELDPKERQDPDWRKWAEEEVSAMLRAALGAWVVPVGCIESHELSEMAANRKSSYDLWNLRTYEPDDTILYTLRQEKPE